MDFQVIGSSMAFIAYMLATMAIISRLFHPNGPNIGQVLILATTAITIHLFNDAQLFFTQEWY